MPLFDREERYERERKKRLQHALGLNGHIAANHAAEPLKLKHLFTYDPWVAPETPVNQPVPNGGHCKILIFGAGFAGVLAAVQCLRAGAADLSDLLIVDSAGDFGGTWYFNRYPGLMCDVESYNYLPMLEEMNYMPKRRYSSGEEIRKYIELIAERHGLRKRTMFQSRGKTLDWTSENRWRCEVVMKPKGLSEETITLTADYVVLCPGNFTYPKLPVIPGMELFRGQMFHPARWRYDVTGGSQTYPEMERLSDKRVAIVGTGATAIQCVPELAKWAQELYVVQRTPASVAWRYNETTDPSTWSTHVANKPGWQRERQENSQAFVESPAQFPDRKLAADDGWTEFPAIAAVVGSSIDIPPGGVEIEAHFKRLRALDDERSDRIRQRVSDTVKDRDTAEKLKAWYPGFSAVFHDEYLCAFNRPNVHLIDTDGRPVEAVTADGLIVNGRTVQVDIIIWATGYGNQATESVAGKAEMQVIGRDGLSMEARFKEAELLTLHGVMPRGFPNLFTPHSAQAGFAMSMSHRLLDQAAQIAYIITEATRRVARNHVAVVEPSAAACEAWADEIASAAHLAYNNLDCTPGFLNLEGDLFKIPAERKTKLARVGKYARGYLAYYAVLQRWKADGALQGLEIYGVAKSRAS